LTISRQILTPPPSKSVALQDVALWLFSSVDEADPRGRAKDPARRCPKLV